MNTLTELLLAQIGYDARQSKTAAITTAETLRYVQEALLHPTPTSRGAIFIDGPTQVTLEAHGRQTELTDKQNLILEAQSGERIVRAYALTDYLQYLRNGAILELPHLELALEEDVIDLQPIEVGHSPEKLEFVLRPVSKQPRRLMRLLIEKRKGAEVLYVQAAKEPGALFWNMLAGVLGAYDT